MGDTRGIWGENEEQSGGWGKRISIRKINFLANIVQWKTNDEET